jgi:hypothetical protein
MDERLGTGALTVELKAGAAGCRHLGEPAVVARIDLTAFEEPSLYAEGTLVVTEEGTLNGILLSFDLGMAPGVSLTNRPDHPPTHWKNPLFPLPVPRPVRPGDEIGVRVGYRPGTDLTVDVLR